MTDDEHERATEDQLLQQLQIADERHQRAHAENQGTIAGLRVAVACLQSQLDGTRLGLAEHTLEQAQSDGDAQRSLHALRELLQLHAKQWRESAAACDPIAGGAWLACARTVERLLADGEAPDA